MLVTHLKKLVSWIQKRLHTYGCIPSCAISWCTDQQTDQMLRLDKLLKEERERVTTKQWTRMEIQWNLSGTSIDKFVKFLPLAKELTKCELMKSERPESSMPANRNFLLTKSSMLQSDLKQQYKVLCWACIYFSNLLWIKWLCLLKPETLVKNLWIV